MRVSLRTPVLLIEYHRFFLKPGLLPQIRWGETGGKRAPEDIEFAQPSGGRIALQRAHAPSLARTHVPNEADFPVMEATLSPSTSDILSADPADRREEARRLRT